jgi:hypothetical protein
MTASGMGPPNRVRAARTRDRRCNRRRSLIASLLSAALKVDAHPCSRAFCAHPQQLRGRLRISAQRHCGKPAIRRTLRLTRQCPRATQSGRPTTGPSAGWPVYAERQRGKERHDAFGFRPRRQTRKRTAAPVSERGRSRPALGGVPTGRSRAAAGCQHADGRPRHLRRVFGRSASADAAALRWQEQHPDDEEP